MLSKRERMIAVGTAVVIGALALDRLALTPLMARANEADARTQRAQQDLERAQRVFQNDQRARRRWKEIAGESLRADAPAAESQVLNRLRDWAQEAGLSLTSLKPERSEKEKGYERIVIRATASGSMRQVSRFLYSVQHADVPLRVSDMQLVPRREGQDDLTLQLGVATIYLPPPAEPKREGQR